MRSVAASLGVLFILSGCPSEPPKTTPIETPVDAGVADAAVAVIDAGPPQPSALEPTVTAELADGGAQPVTPQAEIEPAVALTVALPIALKDFRIRLLDFREQVVASDDALSADGKSYRLVPLKPLATGRGYSLVLDAELGPVVTDPAGGTWNDWQLDFRVAGEVQPEPAEAGKRKPKAKPAKKK